MYTTLPIHARHQRGMTLVEVVVVIGIVSIALPALFSTLIVSTRQQVSISRINEVKSQGDTVLSAMTRRIKNNAIKLCVTSATDTSCATEVCGSTTTSPTNMNSFIDRASILTRYYLRGTSIYESNGATETRLTNDRVKVNSLAIQCYKTSETSRPIIAIQYTVIAEPIGNTDLSEKATLDYSTKIIVDQVDPITQVVSDIAPGQSSVATPTPRPNPTITPTPTPTPETVLISTGGAITDAGGYRTHTFTSSGTLSVSEVKTANVLIVAGGGGGGYAIPQAMESGGGGGGGGVGVGTMTIAARTAYTVTVGSGGNAGISPLTRASTNGTDSSIIGGAIQVIAYGGGRGGDDHDNYSAQQGGNGGSGGGGAGGWGGRPGGTATRGVTYGTGASVTYYGNNGGYGYQNNWGGGGGGAGGAGSTAVGGAGYTWGINGRTYGAGGSINQTTNGSGIPAVQNTGNGGGAGARGGDASTSGGAGGSGIVIIRYPYVAP